MLDSENVSFSYGTEQLINDVSFQIQTGDFVALVGENGAGKTTLSKLCNGLLKPNAGDVLLNGQNTKTTKSSALAKTVGYLFQNPDRQICQNTIKGEIMFGLSYLLSIKVEREKTV